MSTAKPTILHVIDTTGPGGAETVFLDLAEQLEIEGFDTLALITGTGWVQQQLDAREIPYVVLSPYGWLSIPYYFSVVRLCRRKNVRFIQAHLLGSALTVSIVSLLTRIPAIATLHGQVDVGDRERLVSVKRWLLRRGLKRIIAVSRQLARYLESRKLFSSDQVTVIHNGVKVDQYQRPPESDLRKDFGLSSEVKLIGCLGNIRPAKDYPTLIRAAALVIADHPERHFVIAGHQKEPLMSSLVTLVEELSLSENMHFIGFRSNTSDFLSQLDCFALSSASEGFSIATLEAMASGVPVVVTRSGGPEEIIRPDLDGVMVPVNQPQALAKGINDTLDGRVDCTKEALQRVRSDFSMQTMIAQYRNLAVNFMNIMETDHVVSP